jgi:hypothetical protein
MSYDSMEGQLRAGGVLSRSIERPNQGGHSHLREGDQDWNINRLSLSRNYQTKTGSKPKTYIFELREEIESLERLLQCGRVSLPLCEGLRYGSCG